MTREADYQGPLAGLNVIDFGHYYAGPLVGMLLADQGANVIRIVRPGESESELPQQQYRLLNRNKKLLTLDLKTPEGKEQARSLIERADVVIENFRPGVMKRLGLDYTSVKSSNPGLVYLSLPGFASTDKERAHIQAWEGIMGAAACVYTTPNFFRTPLAFPPVYTSVPHCSMYGAMHGVLGIMAALIYREEKGVGTVIETPLVDAGLTGFMMDFQYSQSGPWKPDPELPDHLKDLVFTPADSREAQIEKLAQARLRSPMMGTPSSRINDCSDGRKLLVFTLWEDVHSVERLLNVLGIQKQVMAEGFVCARAWEQPELENNICDPAGLSEQRKQRITQLIEKAFLRKPAEEWETLLNEADVLAAVIRTRKEWMALKPLLDSGVFIQMEKGGSRLTVPGRLTDVAGPSSKDEEEALIGTYREAEYTTFEQMSDILPHRLRSEIQQRQPDSPNKGDLLNGLKVLDMCSYFSGPAAAYFLATLGAEVIKLDPPNPNPIMKRTFFPGKRSIVANLKSAPGQQIFKRLVTWSDVVLTNHRDDVAQRMGNTHRQLQSIKPGVVSCQFSGYGGTWRNGLESRKGVEPMLQSASGLMAHFGSPEEPQLHGMVAAADCPGGLGLAFSALLSTYQQRKTGYAGEGRCSLARAINYYQLPWMINENGRNDWGDPGGQFAQGTTLYQRIYACSDGWMYVGAQEHSVSLLAETVTGQQSTDKAMLEAAFAERDCAYWLRKLEAVNIACHRVLNINDIYHQNSREVNSEDADEIAGVSTAILCWDKNSMHHGYPIYLPAPDCVRIGPQHSYKRLSYTPVLGEHTEELLRELGYNSDEIEELVRLKICAQYQPAIHSGLPK